MTLSHNRFDPAKFQGPVRLVHGERRRDEDVGFFAKDGWLALNCRLHGYGT